MGMGDEYASDPVVSRCGPSPIHVFPRCDPNIPHVPEIRFGFKPRILENDNTRSRLVNKAYGTPRLHLVLDRGWKVQ